MASIRIHRSIVVEASSFDWYVLVVTSSSSRLFLHNKQHSSKTTFNNAYQTHHAPNYNFGTVLDDGTPRLKRGRVRIKSAIRPSDIEHLALHLL